MIYKTNESIIVIQAEAINPIQTGVVFWSHDRGTAKLRFKLQKDGVNQNLPEGTTVPIRLVFKSSTTQGGYGKHDYLATIEDRLNGIVSIVLEDNILGYQGRVDGSIYINFPNDQSLDTAGRFSFAIKRSPIDDSTPELEDYYFNGFSQTIDKVEQMIADAKTEIDDKVAASSTEIDGKLKDTNDKITKANQNVATINSNIDKANDRIDQTNQQIGDLGKLKRMYTNSIDFGDYDYSGNPNLLPKLTANDFRFTNTAVTGYTKTDNGTSMKVTKAADAPSVGLITGSVTRLKSNETYTLSVDAKALTDIVAGGLTFTLRWKDSADVTQTADAFQGQVITTTETTFSKTFTTGVVSDGTAPSLQLYFNGDLVGKNEVDLHYDIKLEKGSTATPYQPNLLDAPYYLSKKKLGFNLLKNQAFPIITTDYMCLNRTIGESYQAGEEYVITLKGKKLATQSFVPRIDNGSPSVSFSSLRPVEGLTDVWTTTIQITQDHINSGVTNGISIYQYPSDSAGTVQIDWLKIEKGDTRTPNISQFKYFGESLKDSSDPTDYSWDITPEYAEKTMNDAVNVHDHQEVEGLKNFKDGLQVGGKNVATEIEDTGWLDLTPASGYSWNVQAQVRRIGKDICFRGALNSTTVLGNVSTLPTKLNLEPSGEMQFDLPCKTSDVTQRARVYIRPNGTIGLIGVSGNSPIFLSGIRYFVE
ncbi:BppU family phage baseplate upper protein [Enterococcus sp. DIV0213j]